MRVYIVWVKGKKVTHKIPLSRMFCDHFVGRPYPRDTRENNSLAWLFSFQSCALHMPFSQEPFSRTSHELVAKYIDLQLSLSLHQFNTKPNIIKSHKIQGTKLKKIQHFLSWNKVNIKHSCKSQLYKNNAVLDFFFFVNRKKKIKKRKETKWNDVVPLPTKKQNKKTPPHRYGVRLDWAYCCWKLKTENWKLKTL